MYLFGTEKNDFNLKGIEINKSCTFFKNIYYNSLWRNAYDNIQKKKIIRNLHYFFYEYNIVIPCLYVCDDYSVERSSRFLLIIKV